MPPRWRKKDDWKEASPKRAGKGRNAQGNKGRGYADGTGGTGAGGLDRDVLKHAAAVKRAVAKMKAEPELNHSASVATYGLAANLSKVDAGYVNDLCKLHSAALLDAL